MTRIVVYPQGFSVRPSTAEEVVRFLSQNIDTNPSARGAGRAVEGEDPVKRIDQDPEEQFVKVAIYGVGGTGKTSFGVTAPGALFLLSERQGLPHIRSAAQRLGRPVPPVLFMDNLGDYRMVLRALIAGAVDKTAPFRVVDDKGTCFHEGPYPETVVVDSLTDACSLVRDEVYREAPPQKASDGLEKVTERHWAALRDRCEKLIRAFRNVPCHVIFLCGLDDKTTGEGDQQERFVSPSMPMRALPGFLCHSVNTMGVTTREVKATRDGEGNRDIDYGIRTTGPSFYLLKPYRPLKDQEVPDFASWVERLQAAGMSRSEKSDAIEKVLDAKSADAAKAGA